MSIHAVDTTFKQFLNPNETKIYTTPFIKENIHGNKSTVRLY